VARGLPTGVGFAILCGVSRNPQPFRPAFAVVRIDGPLDRSMSGERAAEQITVNNESDIQ
jgi:hypothetical protein